MWPLIEHRIKKRRHFNKYKKKLKNRRQIERRHYLNWIELYLNNEDPDIS